MEKLSKTNLVHTRIFRFMILLTISWSHRYVVQNSVKLVFANHFCFESLMLFLVFLFLLLISNNLEKCLTPYGFELKSESSSQNLSKNLYFLSPKAFWPDNLSGFQSKLRIPKFNEIVFALPTLLFLGVFHVLMTSPRC